MPVRSGRPEQALEDRAFSWKMLAALVSVLRMGLSRLALAGFFMGFITFCVHGLPVQWRIEDGGNGHFYELVGNYLDSSQRWSWQEAKAMAESRHHLGMAGHLVSIGSAAENDFLIETFHNAHPWPAWIGLTDSEAYGGIESFGQADPQRDGWVWVTGEPVTFTSWWPGSPDNLRDEDFALMGSQWGDHHLWNDEQGHSGASAAFFVEYEPQPVPEEASGVVMLAAAAFLVLVHSFKKLRYQRDSMVRYL